MKPLGAKVQGRSGAGATRGDERRPAAVHVVVDDDGDGQRLDNHLVRLLKGVPRTWIWRSIRTGEVRLNGRRATAQARLAPGDDIRIPPVRQADRPDAESMFSAAASRPLDDCTIVHEDPAWLILSKPVGLAVHGGSGVAAGLIERLRAGRPQDRFLELAHRLDRETSGLIVVARSRRALLSLHRQFSDGSVVKHYRALVAGRWTRVRARLQFPLERIAAPDGDRRVRVVDGGMTAITDVTRLEILTGRPAAGLPAWFSLLDCQLLTGRTHQIRVHLAHAGFPIVGDPKYGDFALNKVLSRMGAKRMFLHAFSIELDHPIEGHRCYFEAPVPAAFAEFAALGSSPAVASVASVASGASVASVGPATGAGGVVPS
jgi:23S rRNA pseudouridine955/2504/2580 synthase